MRIIDYIKLAFLNIVREKRKIFYSLLILVLIIIGFSIFTYKDNTEKLIDYSLTKDAGFRTLITDYRIPEGMAFDKEKVKEVIRNDISEALKVEYVVDAFNSYHWNTVLTSDFANENLDGTVTLLRGNPKELPPLIAGRKFEEGERGVAICPRYFYPNFDPGIVKKDYVIDGYTILNKSFNVEYYDYLIENKEVKENNKYTKSFKIVGLYNNFDRINDNGTCYISIDDIAEINDTEFIYDESNHAIPGLNVIVDKLSNVDFVRDKLTEMGFDNVSVGAFLNEELINTMNTTFISLFFIILTIIIILIPLYVGLRIKSDEKRIGVLRTCGYSKKHVITIYIFELLIQHTIIYILGTFIFLFAFNYAENNIQFLINNSYLLGGLDIRINTFIFTYLLIAILPCLIILYFINKKCSLDIVDLIGE